MVLKLDKCVSQLTSTPIVNKNTLAKPSERNLIVLNVVEKSTVPLEVTTSNPPKNLHYFYSGTTINALNLATCVYMKCFEMLRVYHRDYVKNFLDDTAGVLLACHSKYLSEAKGNVIDSSPDTDLILCYSTSLLYRLGPFVIPKEIITGRKRISLNLKVGGKPRSKMSKSLQDATQASRSNTKHRRKNPNPVPEINVPKVLSRKQVTGPALITSCRDEAFSKLNLPEENTSFEKEEDEIFRNYLKVQLEGSPNANKEISEEKDKLHKFDESVVKIGELFTKLCNKNDYRIYDLSTKSITSQLFESCDHE